MSSAAVDGFAVMAVVGGAAWLATRGAQLGMLAAARSVDLLGTGLVKIGEQAQRSRAEWEAEHAALLEWEAAARRVIDVNARIEVLRHHGAADLATGIPSPLTPCTQSPTELDEWCRSVSAELDRLEDELGNRIMAAALSTVQYTVDLERTVTAQEALDRYHQVMAEGAGSESARLHADVTRILSRLSPDTTDEDRADVLAAATQVAVPRPDVDHDTLLDELRLRVQRAGDRARARRADAITAATMLQAIPHSTEDPEFVGLRTELASVVAARRALDPELRAKAERAVERIRVGLERDYVRVSVAHALAELGYEVDEGFATVTGNPDRMRLARPDWNGHAVQVVVAGDEVRAAVIRLRDRAGADARREDVEREQQWCQDLEKLHSTLDQSGMSVVERTLVAPGERILPVARESARHETGRENVAREQSR